MASCASPKRRAKPARGKRSAAPMVRTPMHARRATVYSGQRRLESGKGASCPVSCAGSSTSSDLPARAMTSEVDRKSTRLNSSHDQISYAVFCLKKKKKKEHANRNKQTV